MLLSGKLLVRLGLLVAPRLMRTGIEGVLQSKGRPSRSITLNPYSSSVCLGATMHECWAEAPTPGITCLC